MNFAYSFADILFSFYQQNNIPVILARPYYLPEDFIGKDLDILIKNKADIKVILNWIHGFKDLYVTSLWQRSDGTSIMVYGLGPNQDQVLTIDFITRLSLKGIDYLNLNEVFERRFQLKNLSYMDPNDQLLHLLMVHGLKHGGKKLISYGPYIRQVTQKGYAVLEEKLVSLFGYQKALFIEEQLKEKTYTHINSDLVWSYLVHSWLRNGFAAPYNFIKYCLKQIRLRIGFPKVLIAFYGVDGAGKTTLVNELREKYPALAPQVKYLHFIPALPWQSEHDGQIIQADPHGKKNRNAILSYFKILYYLMRYWLDYLWPKNTATIYCYDRYLPEIIVDPKRFRFQGSTRILQLMLKLLPKAYISILVDIPVDTAQKRKKEVSYPETARQIAAYREFIKDQDNALIVHGDQTLYESANQTLKFIAFCLDQKNLAHD